jgi:hypothetical protein
MNETEQEKIAGMKDRAAQIFEKLRKAKSMAAEKAPDVVAGAKKHKGKIMAGAGAAAGAVLLAKLIKAKRAAKAIPLDRKGRLAAMLAKGKKLAKDKPGLVAGGAVAGVGGAAGLGALLRGKD